jgi:hypothetical protein
MVSQRPNDGKFQYGDIARRWYSFQGHPANSFDEVSQQQSNLSTLIELPYISTNGRF